MHINSLKAGIKEVMAFEPKEDHHFVAYRERVHVYI